MSSKTGNAIAVLRMPPSAVAYRAVYALYLAQSPADPVHTWLATIRRDLQQLDIDLDDVLDVNADRVLWRGLTLDAALHFGACS